MTINNESEGFKKKKEGIRENLLKYTLRAYKTLPYMKNPRILDIGCGTGVPTLFLAEITKGYITAFDIDQESLDRLTAKVKKAGLTGKMDVLNLSAGQMNFSEECFDLLWSEGSIYIVGFKDGLREWRRYIKPGGCLVVHDTAGDIPGKLKIIDDNGYRLIDCFELDHYIWQTEYYQPMQELVNEYRGKQVADSELDNILKNEQKEIDTGLKYPQNNHSAYFIMQKLIS